MSKIHYFSYSILLIIITVLLIKFYVFADKVAYIDTMKLMAESKEMKLLQENLKNESAKVQANVDTLSMELNQLIKKHEKELPAMTKKEKELSVELLNSKRKNLINYQQAIQNQMAQKEQAETEALLNNINSIIEEYGKKNQYTLILATTNGNIAYATREIDITEEILEKINN